MNYLHQLNSYISPKVEPYVKPALTQLDRLPPLLRPWARGYVVCVTLQLPFTALLVMCRRIKSYRDPEIPYT